MAKQSPKKLLENEANYFVINCDTPHGKINLGILGAIQFAPKSGVVFFIGNQPKIRGLDAFEMSLVSAVPETVRKDVKRLLSQNISIDKLLGELGRSYRGN